MQILIEDPDVLEQGPAILIGQELQQATGPIAQLAFARAGVTGRKTAIAVMWEDGRQWGCTYDNTDKLDEIFQLAERFYHRKGN